MALVSPQIPDLVAHTIPSIFEAAWSRLPEALSARHKVIVRVVQVSQPKLKIKCTPERLPRPCSLIDAAASNEEGLIIAPWYSGLPTSGAPGRNRAALRRCCGGY